MFEFERTTYNNMFEHFTANNLISPNQSDFKSGNSCITQTLSITRKIYQSLTTVKFEVCFETHRRHSRRCGMEDLIFKLSQYGIP